MDVILARRTSSLSLSTTLSLISPCTTRECSRLTLLELLGPHDISDLNICHRVKPIREIEPIAVPGDQLVLAVVGTAALVVELATHSETLGRLAKVMDDIGTLILSGPRDVGSK